jgi:hypothetical protein
LPAATLGRPTASRDAAVGSAWTEADQARLEGPALAAGADQRTAMALAAQLGVDRRQQELAWTAHLRQGAVAAGGDARVAPAAADLPGGKVQFAGAPRVQAACAGDDVVGIVTVGQTGTQEHPAQVHVVGDVAALQVPDGDAEVARSRR